MRAILMSNLMGTRNHWVMTGYSLCGAVFSTLSDEEDTAGSPLCKTCDKIMKRYIAVAEVQAHEEAKTWFVVCFDGVPDELCSHGIDVERRCSICVETKRETRERIRVAQVEALGLQPVRVDDVMQVIDTGEWGYVMDVDGVGAERVVYLRLYGAYNPRIYKVQGLTGYTTEDDAALKAAERAEQTAVTTLWVDRQGDTWERNEATGQVRGVSVRRRHDAHPGSLGAELLLDLRVRAGEPETDTHVPGLHPRDRVAAEHPPHRHR